MAAPVALPNLRGYIVDNGRRDSGGSPSSRDCVVLLWDAGYDTTITQLSVGHTTADDAQTVLNYISVDYWSTVGSPTSTIVTSLNFPASSSAFNEIPPSDDSNYYFALVANSDGITLFPFNIVPIADIAAAVPTPTPTPTPDPTPDPTTPPAVPQSTYTASLPSPAGSYVGLFTELTFGDRVREVDSFFGFTENRRSSAVLTTAYDVNLAAGGMVNFLGVDWVISETDALLVDGQWVGFRYSLAVLT